MKSEHLRLAAALLFGVLGFAAALSSGGHNGRVLASGVLWLLALVALGLPWRVLLGLAAALALASVVFAALDRAEVARRTLFGAVGVALEAALLYVASNLHLGGHARHRPLRQRATRARDTAAAAHAKSGARTRAVVSGTRSRARVAAGSVSQGVTRTASSASEVARRGAGVAWRARPRPSVTAAFIAASGFTVVAVAARPAPAVTVAAGVAWLLLAAQVGVAPNTFVLAAAGAIAVMALAGIVTAPRIADDAGVAAVLLGLVGVALALLEANVPVLRRGRRPRRPPEEVL